MGIVREFFRGRRPTTFQAALNKTESKLHATNHSSLYARNIPGCAGGDPVGTWVSDNAGEMMIS